MARLEILRTFKHDSQTFHKGELRVVEAPDSDYFIRNGWARDLNSSDTPADPKPADVTLEVQGVRHVLTVSKIGA